MKRIIRRLYVAGKGKSMVWTMAHNMAEAAQKLNRECRVPNADDMRLFWTMSGIATMTAKERREKFGISRQAANYWRRKGGNDLPKRSTVDTQQRIDRVKKVFARFRRISAGEAAKLAHVTAPVVRQVAAEVGYKLATHRRIPEDSELVALATGRTWREFADAAGVRLATLRNYIYKKPELAEQIRRVRKAQPQGLAGAFKLDLQKVWTLGQRGVTAYAIAEEMKVENMTIRAHLMKWGKEYPDAFPPPYGNKRSTREPVAGGNGGVGDQS